jgi:hypothetical protein
MKNPLESGWDAPVNPLNASNDGDDILDIQPAHDSRQKVSQDLVDSKRESGPKTPEIIANPPLEGTSLVYSIPIRGEWANGNVVRLLHAMFSQKIEAGQAFELEFVANHGGILIDPEMLLSEEREKSVQRTIEDMGKSIAFIKRLIQVQALARGLQQGANGTDPQTALGQLLDTVTDPVQREVLKLAAERAAQTSIMLVDTTKMDFEQTDYGYAGIESIRTLGIDAVMARYEGKEDIALHLFDVDTLPENNKTVQEIQTLFSKQPRLSYLFSGMTNPPRGISKDFVAQLNSDLPLSYNRDFSHGSPQICFRLACYRKLREIANFQLIGDEDRDTASRLIYHFGQLQEGLLFEESLFQSPTSPTYLTAARLDGFVDGSPFGRKEGVVYPIEQDLAELIRFRAEIIKEIDSLVPFVKEVALEALARTRKEQEERQRLQQRLNRQVLHTFFTALEQNLIRLQDDTLDIDELKLAELPGGKALRFYLRNNHRLINELLASPQDLACLRYDLHLTEEFPREIQTRTPFQKALREYVGEIASCEELERDGVYDWTLEQRERESVPRIEVSDHRDKESRTSLLHPFSSELLALGHTYRVFFQTKDFFKRRDPALSEHNARVWPKNPDEQELPAPYKFGDQQARIEKLKPAVHAARAPEDEFTAAVFGLPYPPIVRFMDALVSSVPPTNPLQG